jgi:hypothetical protein
MEMEVPDDMDVADGFDWFDINQTNGKETILCASWEKGRDAVTFKALRAGTMSVRREVVVPLALMRKVLADLDRGEAA